MFDALWQLVPVALGVMASPIAIMGLVGILLSRHARRNGSAYLAGWVVCASVLLTTCILTFSAADATGAYRDASWVPVVHSVVGVVCVLGAAWTFRRSRRVVERIASARTPDELAAATPQLPGLIRSVETFTPGRSFFLGLGVFLSPMNIALVAAAGVEIAVAGLQSFQRILIAGGFLLAAAAPVAIPVVWVLIRGQKAEPMLHALRRWMLAHNGLLTAGILAAVGVLQLIRAAQGWLV